MQKSFFLLVISISIFAVPVESKETELRDTPPSVFILGAMKAGVI
jgi:hypothetical protein